MARRRVRSIFSESLTDLKQQTLGVANPSAIHPTLVPGNPPRRTSGGVPGQTIAWRAVVRVLRSPLAAAEDILTTVFPGDCRVCGGPLLFQTGAGPACSTCVTALKPQRGLLCGCCGASLGMESERFATGSVAAPELLCSGCRLAPPAFSHAMAFGVYQDELRRMVHLLKYEGARTLAPILGRHLAEAMARLEALTPQGALVVAVPLYPAKQRTRGYNQAAVLADAAMCLLRLSHPHWNLQPAHETLRRVRDTESQFALTPIGRRRNLRGAFTVPNPRRIAGREIILVDDIFTTGATARECARILRQAGARNVLVATLSRAQTEGIAFWSGPPASQLAQPSIQEETQ